MSTAIRTVTLPARTLVRRVASSGLAPGASVGLVRDPWLGEVALAFWHTVDGHFDPPVEASGLALLAVHPADALPSDADLWIEEVETDATRERARRAAQLRREEAEAAALDAAIWRSGVPS